jgi:ribosomal protein S18 acetylase RimI-like enzyme
MQTEQYRIVRLSTAELPSFAQFLRALGANGDEAFFHPHPLDEHAASAVVELSQRGPDEYWIAVSGDDVLAYGMLRGWSEGYAIPSLGLAVAPGHRGRGIARAMMDHLHGRARHRGASSIRLKVDRRNAAARSLYESLGYALQDHSPTELVGMADLAQRPR